MQGRTAEPELKGGELQIGSVQHNKRAACPFSFSFVFLPIFLQLRRGSLSARSSVGGSDTGKSQGFDGRGKGKHVPTLPLHDDIPDKNPGWVKKNIERTLLARPA